MWHNIVSISLMSYQRELTSLSKLFFKSVSVYESGKTQKVIRLDREFCKKKKKKKKVS